VCACVREPLGRHGSFVRANKWKVRTSYGIVSMRDGLCNTSCRERPAQGRQACRGGKRAESPKPDMCRVNLIFMAVSDVCDGIKTSDTMSTHTNLDAEVCT
jgi:hypothetical protein